MDESSQFMQRSNSSWIVRFLWFFVHPGCAVILGVLGILLLPSSPAERGTSLFCLVLLLLAVAIMFIWFISLFLKPAHHMTTKTNMPGYCQKCGYNLRGLTKPRCPECGTPFCDKSPDLLTMSSQTDETKF